MLGSSLEIYQAFMAGYVRRINEATLKVTIRGVRIGHAKYTRLAQINLRTGIITFSRYAIENVPERCRRYLVVHELAHVKEARHNKRFWNIVGKYVPECRKVEMELQEVFQANIRDIRLAELPMHPEAIRRLENPNLRANSAEDDFSSSSLIRTSSWMDELQEDIVEDCFDCSDEELGAWTRRDDGIVFGGADGPDVDRANI